MNKDDRRFLTDLYTTLTWANLQPWWHWVRIRRLVRRMVGDLGAYLQAADQTKISGVIRDGSMTQGQTSSVDAPSVVRGGHAPSRLRQLRRERPGSTLRSAEGPCFARGDCGTPTVDDMVGIDPAFTGDMTTDEYIAWLRE